MFCPSYTGGETLCVNKKTSDRRCRSSQMYFRAEYVKTYSLKRVNFSIFRGARP